MTSLKSARVKGAQAEINAQHSLRPVFSDIERCGGEGMYQGFDLRSRERKCVFEVKRLKAISWNQLKKFYLILKSRAPPEYKCYVLFQSNHQPCLVMKMQHNDKDQYLVVKEFEHEFGVPFQKHVAVKHHSV